MGGPGPSKKIQEFDWLSCQFLAKNLPFCFAVYSVPTQRMDMKIRFWCREECMLSYGAIFKPVRKDTIKKIELKVSLNRGKIGDLF
jgi:hypothetical protein